MPGIVWSLGGEPAENKHGTEMLEDGRPMAPKNSKNLQ